MRKEEVMALGILRQEKDVMILTLSDQRESWIHLEFQTGLVRIKDRIEKEIPASFPSSGSRISMTGWDSGPGSGSMSWSLSRA